MKAEKDASPNFFNEKNVEGINKRKQDSYLSVIFNQKHIITLMCVSTNIDN